MNNREPSVFPIATILNTQERMIRDAVERKLGLVPAVPELINRMQHLLFPDDKEAWTLDGEIILQLERHPHSAGYFSIWRMDGFTVQAPVLP